MISEPVLYSDEGPEVADIVAGLAHAVYGGDLAGWRAGMTQGLQRPNHCLVLAWHDGTHVGYGKADAREPVSAEDAATPGYYLTGVVVLPAWRRRGSRGS